MKIIFTQSRFFEIEVPKNWQGTPESYIRHLYESWVVGDSDTWLTAEDENEEQASVADMLDALAYVTDGGDLSEFMKGSSVTVASPWPAEKLRLKDPWAEIRGVFPQEDKS
jgi:hypothetical protein